MSVFTYSDLVLTPTIMYTPESTKPPEGSKDPNLDDFVFVPSDNDSADDGTPHTKLAPSRPPPANSLDKTASATTSQQHSNPVPSPRGSIQSYSSHHAKHAPPPPKPSPPTGAGVVKRPGSTAITSQYMFQGDKFKPSPEKRPVSLVVGDKPKPTPRRRHVKHGDTDSVMSASCDSLTLEDGRKSPDLTSSSSANTVVTNKDTENTPTSPKKAPAPPGRVFVDLILCQLFSHVLHINLYSMMVE